MVRLVFGVLEAFGVLLITYTTKFAYCQVFGMAEAQKFYKIFLMRVILIGVGVSGS